MALLFFVCLFVCFLRKGIFFSTRNCTETLFDLRSDNFSGELFALCGQSPVASSV